MKGCNMKYLSLDLETTCLYPRDPEKILQIGLVVEDTEDIKDINELPKLNIIIPPDSMNITGSPIALAMNTWIIIATELNKKRDALETTYRYLESLGIPKDALTRALECVNNNDVLFLSREKTWQYIHDFLDEHFGKQSRGIAVAGKNVASFDLQFLPTTVTRRFSHRTIDVASVLIDWSQNNVPSSQDLADRFSEGAVTHDALDDAIQVIKWLRRDYELKTVI